MEAFLDLYIFACFEEVANFFGRLSAFATTSGSLIKEWLSYGEWIALGYTNIVTGEHVSFVIYNNIFTDLLGWFLNLLTAILPESMLAADLWLCILVGTASWLFPIALFKFFKDTVF